ncbi:MAG TPA: FecR family protein [Gallionella sp.]
MKRIAATILTLALLPGISFAVQEEAQQQAAQEPVQEAVKESVGRVYWASGKVLVAQGGDSAQEVVASVPIEPDTVISTGENSTALVKFDDGQLVMLQSNTSLWVRNYSFDAQEIRNSNVDLVFFQGGVRFITGQIGEQKKLAFKFLTPSATIRGGKTDFLVVKKGESTYTRVLAGKIAMTNSAGTAEFKSVQTAVVSSPIVLASGFYSTIPHGIFTELLSIPVDPSQIVLPEPPPAPEPVVAPEPVAAAEPEAVSEPVAVPVPVDVPVPVAIPEPVPAPLPVPEPPLAEPPAEPETKPAPEPVSSVLAPVPAPACNCSCTCTTGTVPEFKAAE